MKIGGYTPPAVVAFRRLTRQLPVQFVYLRFGCINPSFACQVNRQQHYVDRRPASCVRCAPGRGSAALSPSKYVDQGGDQQALVLSSKSTYMLAPERCAAIAVLSGCEKG